MKYLKKRGLRSEYLNLTDGYFKPFVPSDRLQEVFEENARRAGVPNVYIQAESTLDAIRDAMEGLNYMVSLT